MFVGETLVVIWTIARSLHLAESTARSGKRTNAVARRVMLEVWQEHEEEEDSSCSRNENGVTSSRTNIDSAKEDGCFRGVIFSRSVRSTFASFHVVAIEDDDDNICLVRMQFSADRLKELRSYCRRYGKLGDLLVIPTSLMTTEDPPEDTQHSFPRIVLDLTSVEETCTKIQLQKSYWTISQCQEWQRRCIMQNRPPKPKTTTFQSNPHSNGIEKRVQAEYVVQFLLHMILNDRHCHPIEWATQPLSALQLEECQNFLRHGVLDVAGGSGHVSRALSRMGIHATIVDPRETIGKLPKRDRKYYQTATAADVCGDIHVCRAWFGCKPANADDCHRNTDQAAVPTFAFTETSAIVALHPDEATDSVVQVAVQHQIPFVVVPCCVFYRLFPHRRRSNGESVSTRSDLLEFLQDKDPSIQRTTLPFPGSNTILWSRFGKHVGELG